jgi:uncharacterized protein (TIGR03083 family)
MTTIDYVGSIEADAAALAAAARSAGLDALVPTCPDWKVQDLVQHITGVHTWAEAMVRTRSTAYLDHATLEQPPGDGPVERFEAGAAALVDTLRSTPLDTPVFNWSVNRPQVAEFWPRRMAQETAVHRYDAQAAAGPGSVAAVPTALALDGIDEFLDVFLRARATFVPDTTLGGSLHVHCTDAEGEWLVSVAGGVTDIAREHGKGDAALRGSASDLLLLLWNRIEETTPGATIESFGDPDVLAARRAIAM